MVIPKNGFSCKKSLFFILLRLNQKNSCPLNKGGDVAIIFTGRYPATLPTHGSLMPSLSHQKAESFDVRQLINCHLQTIWLCVLCWKEENTNLVLRTMRPLFYHACSRFEVGKVFVYKEWEGKRWGASDFDRNICFTYFLWSNGIFRLQKMEVLKN
jgi:hypothetical protein